MIDNGLPFALMHAAILCGRYVGCGGPTNEDDYTCMLFTYQRIQSDSTQLDTLADVCERRERQRRDLSPELFAAYGALCQLARWRAGQLREGVT